MGRTLHYHIMQAENGITVDAFLKDRNYSRKNLSLLKKTADGILCNGEPATVRRILHTGDRLTVQFPDDVPSEKILPVPLKMEVLYEDEDLLFVNKPADMPVHPSIHNYENTLANAVVWYYREKKVPFTFRCVTRLDRDTTGVVLLAKNPLAASGLNQQIREHQIRKSYLAFCDGKTLEAGMICAPIARRPGSVMERCVDFEKGEEAITRYRRLFYDARRDFSVVLVRPETGRTHQIRVHLSYVGHPLLGDFLYNPQDHRMQRQALHALQLSLIHPVTGKKITIGAPLPEDMVEIIAEAPLPEDMVEIIAEASLPKDMTEIAQSCESDFSGIDR